jgi:hypothetical protein
LVPSAASGLASRRYFTESQRPLVILLFLMPMILLYEVGTRWTNAGSGSSVEWRIVAFSLIERFFSLFGAGGRFIPPLAVLATLVFWHVASRQPYRLRWSDLGLMAVESALLAVPLVVIGSAMMRYLPLAAGGPSGLASMTVASIGAGIYEEFLFRLVLFALLHFLLCDLLGWSERLAIPTIVLMGAVLFSAYHYLGSEPFVTRVFVFRTLAGVYFGAMMTTRGFGVTAGSHVAYDVIIVLLRHGVS